MSRRYMGSAAELPAPDNLCPAQGEAIASLQGACGSHCSDCVCRLGARLIDDAGARWALDGQVASVSAA